MASSAHMRRRLAYVRASTRRLFRDNGWLLPALGALIGLLLAFLVRNLESSPDPGAWTVSVDRARDTLLAALAIIFSGLSIVLALAAMIAQNAASRFSIRLLRIQQRMLRDKAVIGVFALTAAYIITTQFELRSLPPDALAPQGSLVISAVLVVVSGATIIWYISATMRALRLDRVLTLVTRLFVRTVRGIEHARRLEVPVPPDALEPPARAAALSARRAGYVASIDTVQLHHAAVASRWRIGIEVLVGEFVTKGQRIGWIAGEDPDALFDDDDVAEAVEIGPTRDPEHDSVYAIRLLVDTSLMALSPAVNDPYTAVEVVDQLTVMLLEAAQHETGPRGRQGADGELTVVRKARSIGDYLDLAAGPILLYGAGDPDVRAALRDFAVRVGAAAASENDRRQAEAMVERVDRAALGTEAVPTSEEVEIA